MQPVFITAMTTTTALGRGLCATRLALEAMRPGLSPNDFEDSALEGYIGRVAGLEAEPVITSLAEFDCRNHRLAQLSLRQDNFEAAVARARARYGPSRIAVLMGTTTAGMHSAEVAYRERKDPEGPLSSWFSYCHTQNLFSAADFVQQYLHLGGPAVAVSTACSSSAKVFASACRYLYAGFCDAAVVGGVDSLCFTTLYGFAALELLSRQPCRPCDVTRDGISIGEGAGFALLEREGHSDIALLGYGESSDGYHMSSPHPEGVGAWLALQQALDRAHLAPADIDYINLHGTGSPLNDKAEDQAIFRLFGDQVPVGSTKGWTGHTLGAAGVIEAILCGLCLQHGFLPGTLNTTVVDPALRCQILLRSEPRAIRYVISNAFGFGGANCSLVLGKAA
jgi:3-oxoacyl-[acyl-carrier-protein] synthase-1